jgi:phosphoglycolate phosphatase
VTIRAILFDLDGTLVQTRKAAWELFAETNRQFRLGVDDREAFFKLFEDNFFRSLARICRDDGRRQAATQHFLELLRTQYCPPIIPGMADVIRVLASHCTLAVLSTNTIKTIRRILTEAGLAHCFAHVFAGDVEPDKSISVRRFLADRFYSIGRHCSPAYDEGAEAVGANCHEVVLVTDTMGDIRDAKNCGIRAIGVAWGMHSEAQLLEAGAEVVAIWPQELIALLASEAPVEESCACSGAEASNHSNCALPDNVDERIRAAAEVRRAQRLAHLPSSAQSREAGIKDPSRVHSSLMRALTSISDAAAGGYGSEGGPARLPVPKDGARRRLDTSLVSALARLQKNGCSSPSDKKPPGMVREIMADHGRESR